jgi:hypothetical protein
MMNDPRGPRRSFAPFVAIALAALAAAGCSKKLTSVDPNYTSPEGRKDSTAQQIVYPNLPADVYLIKLAKPGCDECVDELVSTTPAYPAGAGVINGMIFDGTAASGYQILRRELGGGYAPMNDYVVYPFQRFAQSGWKLFAWQDPRPSGFDPPTYQGRGVVAGAITATSPMTNVSISHAGDVEEIHLYDTDSLRTIKYSPVTSAVAYVVQIYSSRGDEAAAIYDAAPAPYASQDHRDFYVAWLPATRGIIDAGKVKVLSQFAFTSMGLYRVRMSAVDAQGRLVGFSYGDLLPATAPEGYARRFPGGCISAQAPFVKIGVTPTPFPIQILDSLPPHPPTTALSRVRQAKAPGFGER